MPPLLHRPRSSRTPRPDRVAGAVLALVGAALLAACGDDGHAGLPRAPADGAAPATPAPRTTWRLLDDLPAEREQEGGPRPPVARNTLLPASGDDRWFHLRPRSTDRGPRLVLEAGADPRGRVALGFEDGPARLVSTRVRPGEALVLQARVRVEGTPPAEDAIVAAVEERREPTDDGDALSSEDVRLLFAAGGGVLVHPASAGNEAATLTLPLLLGPETTELAVYLAAPLEPGSVTVFEELQVLGARAADHLRSGAATGGVEPRGDDLGTARVTLDLEQRPALPLVPGSRVTWTLPALPADTFWRIDYGLGVRPRDPGILGMLGLTWRVDGEEIERATLSAPSSPERAAWHDAWFRLPSRSATSPPRRLELLVDGLETDDPPAAWLGAPILRALPDPRRVAPVESALPNIVLISLDTLRFDRLGCYGNADGLTPHLDALAAEGLRFANAWSTSSYTLPSHASMLTGTLPAFHGAEAMSARLDRERSPFLARALAHAGYHTAAFTGGGFVAPAFGFSAGFDRYGEADPVWALDAERGRDLLARHGGGPGTRREAVHRRLVEGGVTDWITAQPDGAPFFLFLHTYITHSHAPSLAALERFGLLGPDGEQAPIDHRATSAFNDGARDRLAEARAGTLPYYDATVTMADDLVGEVLAALDAAGLADDTIVIVTSDHGEEFGEHDHFGHGRSLYEAVARVPLVARLPAHVRGEREPRVVAEPVSLVDLAPWILRLVGLPVDARMLPPPDLALETTDPPRRRTVPLDLHTSYARESALVRDGLKLHVRWRHEDRDLPEPARLLFDLRDDPAETRDLSADRRATVEELEQRLLDYRAQRTADPDARGLDDLDPATRRSLQQLGYLDTDDGG